MFKDLGKGNLLEMWGMLLQSQGRLETITLQQRLVSCTTGTLIVL